MDDFFGPVVDDPPAGQEVLAGWVCRDVDRRFRVLLDALAMVDDVRNGREPFEEWSSEGYEVDFDPSGVAIRFLHGDQRSAVYGADEVASALEDFWGFLVGLPERLESPSPFRPDLPEWHADLLQWEDTWQRRHPYRGRLGIPADSE